jgi:hypothetical protein
MGHHYVPQEYLRGFRNKPDEDTIWMYDKQIKNFNSLRIKSVAQSAGFYTPVEERQLNELVESPANPVLRKMREGAQPIGEERLLTSVYIATMLFRVPAQRTESAKLLPKALEEVCQEVREQLDAWSAVTKANESLIARRFTELD